MRCQGSFPRIEVAGLLLFLRLTRSSVTRFDDPWLRGPIVKTRWNEGFPVRLERILLFATASQCLTESGVGLDSTVLKTGVKLKISSTIE